VAYVVSDITITCLFRYAKSRLAIMEQVSSGAFCLDASFSSTILYDMLQYIEAMLRGTPFAFVGAYLTDMAMSLADSETGILIRHVLLRIVMGEILSSANNAREFGKDLNTLMKEKIPEDAAALAVWVKEELVEKTIMKHLSGEEGVLDIVTAEALVKVLKKTMKHIVLVLSLPGFATRLVLQFQGAEDFLSEAASKGADQYLSPLLRAIAGHINVSTLGSHMKSVMSDLVDVDALGKKVLQVSEWANGWVGMRK
jgi:hypothetical protein